MNALRNPFVRSTLPQMFSVRPAHAYPFDVEIVKLRTPGRMELLLQSLRARWLSARRNGPAVLLTRCQSPRNYRRILVPMDFSAASIAVVRAALCVSSEGQVALLHAFHSPEEDTAQKSHARFEDLLAFRMSAHMQAVERMRRFTASLPRQSRRLLTFAVHHGPAVAVIGNYARRFDADLIVIGRSQAGRAMELPGMIERGVSDVSSCDVLIVPSRQ